jgi:CarD family transcriptional regulator
MLKINDCVIYGSQGVCQVEDIRKIKFHSDPCAREYYVLKPVWVENSIVYIPTENRILTEKIRPVLTPEEVDQVILSVKDQSMEWIADRKLRSARFQEILSKHDEHDLLLLAGCLYWRAQESPKKLSFSDEKVLKTAEKIIEQEFSFSLRIGAQSVGDYIRQKLGIPEETGTA